MSGPTSSGVLQEPLLVSGTPADDSRMGRITFVTALRMSTIRNPDCIVVPHGRGGLEQGMTGART